jgi:hypothetical protein
LTIWPTCRGPWRPAASDSAVAPSSTPGSPKSKVCPARPRRTSPRPILGPAPLRAFYSVPSDVGVRADHAVLRPATNRAAVLLIETDSKSLIGPIFRRIDFFPVFRAFRGSREFEIRVHRRESAAKPHFPPPSSASHPPAHPARAAGCPATTALAARAQQNDGGACDPVGPAKADFSPPGRGWGAESNRCSRRRSGSRSVSRENSIDDRLPDNAIAASYRERNVDGAAIVYAKGASERF